MYRVLVVANRSIGGKELEVAVRDRLANGAEEFHVIVPVGNPVTPAIAAGAAAAEMTPTACFDFDTERDAAEQRLAGAIEWFANEGVNGTGELSVDPDVAGVVARLVAEGEFSEVIVSTLASALSRWLRQDLPHRIQRKVTVPVTVVTPA